jgi:hypothetical protein
MRRRRLTAVRGKTLAGATDSAPERAGMNRPVDVVAAIVFILSLFFGQRGANIQMTEVLCPISEHRIIASAIGKMM